MFWPMNFYKWNITRWIVPKVFQAAAKEKLQHIDELKSYENKWNDINNSILSIHGKKDRIVPYQNSLFLKSVLEKEKFKLVTIENGRHELVWSNFELIKSELLKIILE